MGNDFVLAPLCESRILQAYPLVREVAPDVSLEAWRAYAQTVLRPRRRDGRGIVAVYSENEYLRGLFVYRIVPDMQGGRALVLECFVVSSLFVPHAVASALLAGAEDVAREHGCGTIRAELRRRPDWLDALLHEHGYDHRACTLGKPVTSKDVPARGRTRPSPAGSRTSPSPD
ncbi:MAG: GNAT family N-acetyltransferase [Alphaproteobacteria bacterium]